MTAVGHIAWLTHSLYVLKGVFGIFDLSLAVESSRGDAGAIWSRMSLMAAHVFFCS